MWWAKKKRLNFNFFTPQNTRTRMYNYNQLRNHATFFASSNCYELIKDGWKTAFFFCFCFNFQFCNSPASTNICDDAKGETINYGCSIEVNTKIEFANQYCYYVSR